MSAPAGEGRRLLALVPASRRLGFAVLETPNFPLDRGVCDLRKTDVPEAIERSVSLIEWYLPDYVVLENPDAKGFRRGQRAREIIMKVAAATSARKIDGVLLDKAGVRQWAAERGHYGKFGLCRSVAEILPELQTRIPPLRQPWQSEHHRLPMFEALAMIFTFDDQQVQ